MSVVNQLRQLEIELYKVLEKANLLQYYENFIALGGDDVSQLCYASKQEFDEYVSLVGMSSKPLHVRRLQKALVEWRQSQDGGHAAGAAADEETGDVFNHPVNSSCSDTSAGFSDTGSAGCSQLVVVKNPDNVSSPDLYFSDYSSMFRHSNRPDQSALNLYRSSDLGLPVSLLPNAELTENQIQAIKSAVDDFFPTIPEYPARELNPKNKVSRLIEACLHLPLDDENRLPEIQRLSAIYGRFDAPRRTRKPMNLHEVSVNEAAYQLCVLQPALLTRRDDLFVFSRQAIRLAGIQPTSGCFSSKSHNSCSRSFLGSASALSGLQNEAYGMMHSQNKRAKYDPSLLANNSSSNDDAIANIHVLITLGKTTLAELVQRQDQLRAEIKLHKEDQVVVSRLQQELDQSVIRQSSLIQEQTNLIMSLKSMGGSVSSYNTVDILSVKNEQIESTPAYTSATSSSNLTNIISAAEIAKSESGDETDDYQNHIDDVGMLNATTQSHIPSGYANNLATQFTRDNTSTTMLGSNFVTSISNSGLLQHHYNRLTENVSSPGVVSMSILGDQRSTLVGNLTSSTGIGHMQQNSAKLPHITACYKFDDPTKMYY